MHSPAAALAWEFWGRHRLGLSAVAALVLGFAVVCAISPLSKDFAALYSMWLVLALSYVIGVFAYGFEGKLETPESGFPARLFLLPVRTWVLVGWPMVQGVVVAVLVWLAWDHLVLRPCGIETPSWWPVMLAAVVAASQALIWLPFGLPWVRLLLAIVVLTLLIRAPAVLALFGERFNEPDTQSRALVMFGAAVLPVSFLLAWAGVSNARCGNNPDWLRTLRSARFPHVSQRFPRPFASAMAAQMWYEWRARGRKFVVTVACILAVLAVLGALLERDPKHQTNFGVMFLLVPMLLAPFWSSYAGTAGVTERSGRLSAFTATRPLSDSAFVAAKFRAAAVAAVTAWVLVLVVFPAWLLYTGGYHDLGRVWDAVAAKLGAARAVGFFVLFAGGSLLMTWRMLVVGLWAGLTGRGWVPIAHSVVVGVLGLQLMSEWTLWNADPVRQERLRALLPWLAVGAVVLKVFVGWWAVAVLRGRGELETGALAKRVGAWVGIAAGLCALLLWIVPEGFVPRYGLVLGAVLAVPFTRLAVAPIVFAWNRHR